LPAAGEARADWQIVSDVGAALGHPDAFSFTSAADGFREHAALSAFENNGTRPFDLGGLSQLTDADYDALEPVQWPLSKEGVAKGLPEYQTPGFQSVVAEASALEAPQVPGDWRCVARTGSPAGCTKAEASATTAVHLATPSGKGGQGTARLFTDGRFATPDHRANFVAIHPQQSAQQPTTAFPLVVNTGRIRDQWHTMTRTGLAPRLWQHRAEPFIEAHPADLVDGELEDGQLARLQGPAGAFVGRVRVTESQRPGEVFIPIHWNQQFSGDALASQLMAPEIDPVSGQPDSKHGIAQLEPMPIRWEARLLCRDTHPRNWQADHWSRVPLDGCDSWWLAGKATHQWQTTAQSWLGGAPQVIMADPVAGRFRAARFQGGRLLAVLIVEPVGASVPDLGWLAGCFKKDTLDPAERRAILACRDAQQPDVGPIVCSCFQVGEKQIQTAIENGAGSVEALGESLRCGTNCGSCLPELKGLVG
jgi:assimilatory nitrate reductase catalytic subunit